jgi:hypothetical protein
MPTWDDVIDETARRLTDGQPRRGFTARVVARLDERPRRWSRAWLIAPAAAAAIVVVLAVIMPRERPGDAASNLRMESVGTDVRLKPDATKISKADVTNASGDGGAKTDTRAPDTTAVRPSSAAINTDLTLAALEMPPLTTAGTEVHALPDLAPLESDDPLAIAPIDAFSGQ